MLLKLLFISMHEINQGTFFRIPGRIVVVVDLSKVPFWFALHVPQAVTCKGDTLKHLYKI